MDIFDLLFAPLYLIAVLFFAYKYKTKHEHENEAYKYFLPGLIAKFVGAIGLGLVYFYYYGGGDTVNYFNTARAFSDTLINNPSDFIHLYFGTPFKSEYYLFNVNYEFTYWINDPYAFFVSKLIFPVVLIGMNSYVSSAILIASICYYSIWKMYLVFIEEFPDTKKELAISILFIPSVVFWGSGIMKDSITLSSTCLFVYGFYWLFVKRRYSYKYIISILLASVLLIFIKPYILVALLPGSIVWFVALRVTKIKNGFIRVMIAPSIIAVGAIITFYIMNSLGDAFGKYSIENVFETAQNAQQDLKRAAYKGNSFDIGNYEPTPIGLLSVSHKAIFAALFRPTILDVRNIVMFISAIENTLMILFCVYLLIKLKVYKFFTLIRSNPLITFSIIFSLFFAFSVGLSISNFGTLVRLKIPCIPFFVSSLFMINSIMKKKQLNHTL